jgi:hypothetical protein
VRAPAIIAIGLLAALHARLDWFVPDAAAAPARRAAG